MCLRLHLYIWLSLARHVFGAQVKFDMAQLSTAWPAKFSMHVMVLHVTLQHVIVRHVLVLHVSVLYVKINALMLRCAWY